MILKNLKGKCSKSCTNVKYGKKSSAEAYVEQFSLAQFSVPPLFRPLVKKMIRKYLGANPELIFDTFAINLKMLPVSVRYIRQLKNGKKLAVKIQYPGVADSISSDLSDCKTHCVEDV